MRQYCQYHPNEAAHWYCDACGKTLCPQCVDAREVGGYHQGEKLYMCPNCNLQVQWLGVANIIDPFWKRIPQFFLYPFAVQPLALMLGMAMLGVILSPFGGIIGKLADAALWGLTFKYAYAILLATAGGDLTAPQLNSQTLSENFSPVIKQVGIYIAIYFVAGALGAKLGPPVAGLFLILAFLFLPAMIILLVTTESLIQAINPFMFITLATRIGWAYLAMFFFYTTLGGAPAVLGHHVIQYLPPMMRFFIFNIVTIYYTFIAYHLMGYVILQYHEDIGYRVDFNDFKEKKSVNEEDAALADDPESRLLRRINQQIKDGDHQGAIQTIEEETRRDGIGNSLLSERYYTLLKITGATEKQLSHGKSHLRILVQENKKNESVEVYMECLSKNAGFLPDAGVLFKVGSWLNESGKSKEAIDALNKLAKSYPQDPLVPKSYFRAAQILNDRLMNSEKARKILNGLIKKYPGHDIIPFVERYLGQIGS